MTFRMKYIFISLCDCWLHLNQNGPSAPGSDLNPPNSVQNCLEWQKQGAWDWTGVQNLNGAISYFLACFFAERQWLWVHFKLDWFFSRRSDPLNASLSIWSAPWMWGKGHSRLSPRSNLWKSFCVAIFHDYLLSLSCCAEIAFIFY